MIQVSTNTITLNTGDPCTAFGSETLKDGIIEWKIKVISMTRDEDDAYPILV